MDKLARLRFQADLAKDLYLAERARVDSVRASLALPLAALTFSSFGLVSFANVFAWQGTSRLYLALSIVSLVLALAALVLLARAGFLLMKLRYAVEPITPTVFGLEHDIELIDTWLESDEDDDVAPEAIEVALQELSESYSDSFQQLVTGNRASLERQQSVLMALIVGWVLLIAAIFLSVLLTLIVDIHEPVTLANRSIAPYILVDTTGPHRPA